jgi:hypothetical protein
VSGAPEAEAGSAEPAELPAGEYAIVEVLGHRTIIGRVEEVERFGAKLMSIQPIFNGALLPAVMIGGSSIYQFTPCSAATALARQPRETWQLPQSVRAVLPPALLPSPELAIVDSGIHSPFDDEDELP